MAINDARRPVNYDEVSATYNERYKSAYTPEGVTAALLELAQKTKARRIVEIGCGTGHWLDALQSAAPVVCGMDRSDGMLHKARERNGDFRIIRGDAGLIPFRKNAFDLVFCVNAIHHFDNPSQFIGDARQLLRQGGALSIVGIDPHSGQDRWFIYDYFSGTYERDLQRFPSSETVVGWMNAAGLQNVGSRVAEHLMLKLTGEEILPLDKNLTSQLSLLTPEAFADGVVRMEAAVAEAQASGKTMEFISDISLIMITGWLERTD
jgi:SAM-dependent methyltransferase